MAIALAARDFASLRARMLAASSADGAGGSKQTGVRWWLKFCLFGRHTSPLRMVESTSSRAEKLAEETLLMDFALWLVCSKPSGRKISVASAAKYISQVRAWHARQPHGGGELGGGIDMVRLRAMLKGMRRELREAKTSKPRYGVRPQHLSKALELLLGSGSAEDANWRAALSVGLCALMRGGEIGRPDGEAWNPLVHLTRSDLTFFRDARGVLHARIMMRPLKSERHRNSKDVPVILAEGGSLLDPVRELWNLCLLDPVDPAARASTPLFRMANGEAPCTSDVRTVVKWLMQGVGCDPAHFGAHSLRIGGATAALTAGISPQTIRLMGRWATDCYDVYLRMTRETAARVGATIGSTPFTDLERGFQTEELEALPAEFGLGDVDFDPPSGDEYGYEDEL